MEDNLTELAVQVVNGLRERGEHIALAESCTGGLVAKTLTDVSGASEVFECGIVSYSSRIKSEVLGVDPEIIEKYSVVSEPVAEEMARGVRRVAGADYGVGITGVAGPGPDGDHPECDFYVAVTVGVTDHVTHLMTGTCGERTRNRQTAAACALKMVKGAFLNE